MQQDQFVGPKWVMSEDGDRYEIVATLPPRTTEEQIDIMTRNLLKERFHLKYHLEQRPFDTYELLVAKGGPKLHDAEIPAELPTVTKGPSRKPTGRDGFPILPAGWPTGVGASSNGNMYLNMTPGDGFVPVNLHSPNRGDGLGLTRFTFRMVTITQLLGQLQRLAGLGHVVDHTGLKGKYDIKLACSLGGASDTSEPGPDMFSALEKQLGLTLKKARAPLDVIVIDYMDRVPVAN